ncbi:MAG: lysylphosphatidylglycerol synthase domain-containing protein, partial [Nocardioides sp.]
MARWSCRLASGALVVLFLGYGLPRLVGAPWRAVGTVLATASPSAYVALAGLWIVGLCVHTVTLTAALPRLTHRQALTLSLTGSAVSNVLPVGGAAGVALNYRMLRSWGFDGPAFAGYTVVSNLWDVLAKLCLPALAALWLTAGGAVSPGRLVPTTVVTSVALVAVSALTLLTLTRAAVARRVGLVADAVLDRARALVGRPSPHRVGPAVMAL